MTMDDIQVGTRIELVDDYGTWIGSVTKIIDDDWIAVMFDDESIVCEVRVNSINVIGLP